MKTQNIVIFIGMIISLIYKTNSYKCDRQPPGLKNRNRNDAGRWILEISGNPKFYTPRQRYNISLKLNPSLMIRRHFKSFIITLEQDQSYAVIDQNINYDIGHFEFGEDMLAKFSDRCPNTVVEASSVAKTEVHIYWVAPSKNSGCVAIKATVVETKENWFSEDGPLTKILCEESSENENVQPMILDHCCACDEAKYEVAFEGLWTRNTHPKDFPSDVWSTRFSDVIGASHKIDSAFWNYRQIASAGLKELAEDGTTRSLESELKDMSDNIRTIIKARGLQYPNITLSTYAVFRVDKENHLVSLVSKISPSPDWIVGVSNFELCRADCSWVESKVLNLYPWDAGTDDGIGYTSPDQPAYRQQPIRRITPNSPNDPRSPFYDESGADMKPIARLQLTRQRIYEKVCDSYEQVEDENVINDECATTDWSDWTRCTAKCGKGFIVRERQFINPESERKCQGRINVTETKPCYGQYCSETNQRGRTGFDQDKNDDERNSNEQENPFGNNEEETEQRGEEEEESGDQCELTEWSEWSSCSSLCGRGTRTRDRKFKNPNLAVDCRITSADLQENEECQGQVEGNEQECENFEEFDEDECPNTVWGEWSPCSATCDSGTKQRQRIPLSVDEEFPEECVQRQETVICEEAPCEPFGRIPTGNHVSSMEVIREEPVGDVTNCKVSRWNAWSACIPNDGVCGKGIMKKEREILIHASNGGRACPKKLHKIRNCILPCDDEESEEDDEDGDTLATWGPSIAETENINGCIMSKWSAWSPCSTNCGEMAVRQRTRSVIRREPGAICPPRLEQKKCPLPLACTGRGNFFN